ncbi:ATP-binding protein [Pleurocapsales cyanobacterium LEGE 10410]|nr:ATP-binding protein [Pleurocapsales cyanobacterium LEGE 10410]
MKSNLEVKQYHLQVKTELEDLKEVLHWFEGLIFPLIPQKVGWQCEVALVEAFTNAVRHAHQNLPKNTPIDLEVELLPNFLEMRIWDRGQSFDLQDKLRKGEQQASSMEKEGGRGLHFIDKLTDELQYLSLPNHRNCLVMRKKYYI